MPRIAAENVIKRLFEAADIQINGSRPWDIKIHNSRFYDLVMTKRDLAFGESYMVGWWDCEDLDTCVYKLLKANVAAAFTFKPKEWLQVLAHRIYNFQNQGRAEIVAKQHYDFGNDLFCCMLDKNMVYSCAYWKEADDLDQAQINKLDLICKKLHLTPGMKLLDIGCGWGSLAKFAAEKYNVEVIGITISKEQAKLAEQRCQDLPVKIILQDYRNLKGSYDRIASIGMFEHVGYKNYRQFMQIIKNSLRPGGLCLLHTMGSNYTVYNNNEWLEKYIFPNGMLPSIKQLGAAWEKLLIMEDWHNFGPYYNPTLMSWYHNFTNHWEQLRAKYSEQFRRMWEFYLLSCAGSARARLFQVWQIVLSNDFEGPYQSFR